MRKMRLLFLTVLLVAALPGCGKKEYQQGVKYLQNGQYEEAADYFQTAIEKKDNLGDSYRGLGICLWEAKDYENAASAFESALEKGSKETGTVYNLLGCCVMKTGDYDRALEYFAEGLRDDSCSQDLKKEMEFNRIVALEKQGDIDSAKTYLTRYLEQYPQDEAAVKEAQFLGVDLSEAQDGAAEE